MPKFVHNRLTFRILAMFLCVILFQGVVLSVTFTLLFSQIISEQVLKSREETLAQMEQNVSSITQRVTNLIQTFELSLPLEPALLRPNDQTSDTFRMVSDLQNRLYQYALTDTINNYDILVYGVNGTEIYNATVTFGNSPEAFTSQPWYSQLLKNPGSVLWLSGSCGVFKPDGDPNAVVAAKLLRSFTNNTVYGIALIRFREGIFYNIYSDQSSSDSKVVLLNANSQVISSSDRGSLGSVSPVDSNRTLATGHWKVQTIDGVPYLLIGRFVQSAGLRIYSLMPQKSLIQYSQKIYPAIILVTALCFLFSVAIAIGFTKSVANPLVQLLQKIRTRHRLSPTEEPFTGRGELHLLTTEYDVLVANLDSTISLLEEEQQKKRTAELQMLQAQINPHFLYNTLSSIKCLVWTGRTEMIEPMIDSLINLLENTITQNNEMVPLTHDLKCIEDYLTIQRIRIARDIPLKIRCTDPSLMNLMLPKLLLQPIVENAIFHGIESIPEGGEITITISREEQSAIILIEDDGYGISPEVIHKSMEKAPDGQNLSHIGMRNVAERLHLYYGENGRIRVFPRRPRGTAVEIRITLNQEGSS